MRFQLSDARWFSDKRPQCVIENEWKQKLKAKDETQYSDLLQKNGEAVFAATRKVPVLNVKATDTAVGFFDDEIVYKDVNTI